MSRKQGSLVLDEKQTHQTAMSLGLESDKMNVKLRYVTLGHVFSHTLAADVEDVVQIGGSFTISF